DRRRQGPGGLAGGRSPAERGNPPGQRPIAPDTGRDRGRVPRAAHRSAAPGAEDTAERGEPRPQARSYRKAREGPASQRATALRAGASIGKYARGATERAGAHSGPHGG